MTKKACLNREELSRLTQAWANWAVEPQAPARILARARLHLVFLLARFGAMRYGEICAFGELASLDHQTGLLQLKDRRLFLPPAAMRPLRRILSLPEAATAEFLHLDAGFVRKTFYALGRSCGLAAEACAPRALRYARALELLESHVEPQVVAAALGLASPLPIIRLMARKNGSENPANHFIVMLAGMETDLNFGRLFFAYLKKPFLQGVFSLSSLADLDPVLGKPVSIFIPPGLIFPSPRPLPLANRLHCEVLSIVRDSVQTRMRLLWEKELELLTMPDTAVFDSDDIKPGMKIDAWIPAQAISLVSQVWNPGISNNLQPIGTRRSA